MVSSLANKSQDEERKNARHAFLKAHDWDQASQQPFTADASRRRYWRLSQDRKTCLLMDMLPHPEENFKGYVEIGATLHDIGLSAPAILAIDHEQQFALIEDFGDQTYTRLLNDGADPAPLYRHAVEAMALMHDAPVLDLELYDHTLLMDEVLRFIDWYLPLYQNEPATQQQRDEFELLFSSVLQSLPALSPVMVLRDFHVDNLMWLEHKIGVVACGILDFQDGRIGSPAYDLMSLIEDARRDLNPVLANDLKQFYLSLRPELSASDFEQHFAVLGAQRHARILGQFIRLWLRDGKPHYLQFLPRVAQQFTNAIQHPAMRDIKSWIEENAHGILDFMPDTKKADQYRPLIADNLLTKLS